MSLANSPAALTIPELKDEIKVLQAKVASLVTEVANQKRQRDELQRRMFEIQRTSGQREQASEEKIRELAGAVSRMKSSSPADTRTHSQEDQSAYLRLLVLHEESQQKLKEAESRVEVVSRCHDLEISRLLSENDRLVNLNGQHEDLIGELRESLRKIREQPGLSVDVEALKEENHLLKQELQSLQAQASDRERQMRDHEKQLSEKLNASIAGLNAQNHSIRDENVKLKKRLQGSGAKLRRCEELESQNNSLSIECSGLRIQNEHFEAQRAEFEAQISELVRTDSTRDRLFRELQSKVDLLSFQNSQLIEENDRLADSETGEEDSAAIISDLRDELDEARFVISELLKSDGDQEEFPKEQYLDTIRTLQLRLEDAEMIERRALQERDEMKKANAKLVREARDLSAALRKRKDDSLKVAQMSEMEARIDLLARQNAEHEAVKKRTLQKLKAAQTENATFKTTIDQLKAEISRYRFQLLDAREQMMTMA
jgi:chromosome segregation ATPase